MNSDEMTEEERWNTPITSDQMLFDFVGTRSVYALALLLEDTCDCDGTIWLSDGIDDEQHVQDVPEYPYEDAAPDDMTIAGWVAERFTPNYPGIDISFEGVPENALTRTTLGELRRRN